MNKNFIIGKSLGRVMKKALKSKKGMMEWLE